MKNYYEILGIKKSASDEEIRLRWVELMKQYHPDVRDGKVRDERTPGENVPNENVPNENVKDEKVKEINEAYDTLKYSSTRAKYDLKMAYEKRKRRQSLRKKILRFSMVGIPVIIVSILFYLKEARVPEAPPPPSTSVSKETNQVNEITQQKQTIDKRAALEDERAKPASPSAPHLQLRKDRIDEKNRTDTGARIDQMDKKAGLLPPPVQKEDSPPARAVQKEQNPPPSAVQREVAAAPPPSTPSPLTKEAAAAAPPSSTPGPLTKEVAPALASSTPSPPTTEAPPAPSVVQKQVGPPAKEVVLPPSRPQTEPQPLPSALSSPLIKEEVKRFLSGYVDRYTQRDIDGFLAFFSPRAVQNDKEGMERIRKIYSQLFSQSKKLAYQIKDLNIDLQKDSAQVRASYEIDQVPNEGDRRMWRGEIEWVLVKEHGDLKISRLRYFGKEMPQLSAAVSKPDAGPSSSSPPKPPTRESRKEQRGETDQKVLQSPLMQEEEVRLFLSRYVERYNERDIDGFLSLFSPKVIQNRKDGIGRIRKTYTGFFSESEKLTYQVKDTKIDPLRETARVRASYEIEQVLKAGGVRMWRGDIEWLLIKEAGELKISTIQFSHDRVR